MLHALVQTAAGYCTVLATLARAGKTLTLQQVHVEGRGMTRSVIKQAATELGLKEHVARVVVQGGVRTSGAKPGSIPRPIEVEVKG